MIEPDINEQMSNFAPSQNAEDLLRSAAPQEGLSMTEAIMPRASMPLPAAPKQPMLDPGLQAAVDEMASQRSAVMNASLYNASKKNPDTVGEAQRLAQQMGVGADIAERNLEEMRRGAAMVRALDRNLATSAPKTANALTEPDFANIAFDDLENLTGAEKLMRWYAGTDFFKGAQGTFIQTEMSIIDQLNSEGMATPQDFERYKELQRDLHIVGAPTEGSWTGSFANILASVGAGVPDAAEYAVIGANVGGVAGAIGGPFAPATVPAGLMLGASAGFATGMAKWMYQAMAGESYRQLREAEVPHDVAVPVSRGVGVITSALEFAGLGAEVWIASGVGKKLFAKEVATEVNAKLMQELTRRATLRGAVYEGAKLYVGEMLAESTVEATQSLITRVGTELARSYSRPDLQNMMQTPEGRLAIIGEAVDAFVTTAKGMALMAAPLPAVNFYIDRGRAADAQRSQKFYEDLSKNAVDSKVRQRNPDAAERHFAAVMDGTGAETTYVNAHVMQNILNQAGVTAEQVDSVLPGLSKQLADALAQGGDVTMPTATWAAKLAGTKLGDAMKPHMRPNAQAWSADTAAKYQAEVQQRKAEALAIEAEKETTDSTFVDEARAVEKEALAQLEAAGQDKKLAKLNAQIYRDMVVVLAADPNRNQTPAQVHAEIGPDIFGPQGMQTAQTVAPGQVSPQTQTSARLTETETKPLQTALGELATRTEEHNARIANEGREESHPQAKAGRALKDSVRRLNDAINVNDEVEIAHQAWRLRDRLETLRQNLDSNAIASVEEMLAKLDAFMQQRGIEINDPIGEKYVDGWAEVEVVSWEEVDKKNPEPDTIKQTIRPIIRRNGQVASRGQVIATYATEADLKRHEEKQAQRKAELLAKLESRQIDAPPSQPAPVLEQAAQDVAGANTPGVGVANENKLGFWPALRVRIQPDATLPDKPLILTGTTNKNATKQLANIDDILGRFPNAAESPEAWAQMLAYAFGTDDVPVPPYAFIRDTNGEGSFERLSTLTDGQIADATHGFDNAREFRRAYTSGELDVITTGKLFLWSFLSRGVSPYTQESLFIDAFDGADVWIKKAAQGKFTEADFDKYEKWAKSVAPQGSGQPGAGATHNLNAFGKNFLMKMGAIGPDGKSNLQRLHDMMCDPNQTGKQIRREFATFGEGVGIDNKVVSFTLLVAGFNDVMVLDRVQVRQLWDDGRFSDTNLYDGVNDADGKKIAGSSLNAITEGVRGILIYEAIERQLNSKINEMYTRLGRPQDGSIGRYHWETWVAYSQQEAAHATLDAILLDAKGDDQAISKVSGKQGEYGAYEYGTQYNRDQSGTPWFRYVTPLGGTYDFSVPAFRQFLTEIKKPANKVVPTKFKVTESGNAPWYTRPEVNQQQLEEQAAKHADRGGGTGEGTRLVREAAENADAIRARSGPGVQSAGRSGLLEQAAASPAFYSALEREVTAIDSKTLTAAGWGERLKGLVNKGAIKAEELEWSGLLDYLKMQEGKVSKDTVLEFLRGNGVRVEREAMSGSAANINELQNAVARAQDAHEDALDREDEADRGDDEAAAIAATAAATETRQNLVRAEMALKDAERGVQAKYQRYTLPGGTNYREVLLTLPSIPNAPELSGTIEALPNGRFRVVYPGTRSFVFNTREDAESDLAEMRRAMGENPSGGFSSSHWDQPNVLVHLRMNDRVDADGKRVLFVEEVQSDWGQEGRKRGFENPARRSAALKEFSATKFEYQKLAAEQRRLLDESPEQAAALQPQMDELGEKVERLREIAYASKGIVTAPFVARQLFAVFQDGKEVTVKNKDGKDVKQRYKSMAEAEKAAEKIGGTAQNLGMQTDTEGWLNLGLKQIMLEAVRGGYDRVAFIDGEQSKDRYDLSKQISRIVYQDNSSGGISKARMDGPPTAGILTAYDLDGKQVINKRIDDPAELEDHVGKEVAQRLLEGTPKPGSNAGLQTRNRELSGLDLKVGGEGMQDFYDNIVPAAMGKLLKKYGGEKLVQITVTEPNVEVANQAGGGWNVYVNGMLDAERPTFGTKAEAMASINMPQPGFDITPELVKKLESGLPLFQAVPERGPPRGQYDANRIAILLNTKASATTFFHELIHWRMDMAIRMVNQGKASAQEAADVDTLFKSFNIAGDTPQERLATWNKMSIEQQRPHWETVAYNSEIYLFEGKAPSVEMQGVFDRLHAFVKRVYVSIKTELNDLYRREFGKDLPILTGEVREVMDRWLASEEQIQRKQAMMQMVPLFLTQEESGMDDATWAQHQQASKEAEEAAVTDLTKASLRQMEWLSGARSRILKKLQSLHDDLRKKTRAEVMEEVKNEPVYAAMSILKTGEGRAKNGELVKFNDKFKLNLEMVKKMLPEEQVRQLGYGKYGMVAEDGISPDMVAEMVGFSSGDELVLAILAAKPLKEEVNARTDRRMMEEHGELNTPQAMEEAVQRALHNEARARFNAVYVRFLSKSTAPVQAFMDATKLAARQIISGKVIRDLRPGDHQAAEAKAARDAAETYKSRRTAEQAAKAAETKERNVGLSAAAAGVPMALVDAAAAAKGQEAAQRVAEREAEYKAKYGDRTPEQVMLRAKQIQLLQNQLAREAQEAKDEVAKAVKDFRKFFKADDKLAKTRNMDLVDAARAILSAFGFGKFDKSPAEYIEKLKAYNPEMYAAIEPLVMAATSGSKNYKDLTVEQFRQLREVVDALWEQSRRDKLVEIDGKMVALADVVGELETRLDEIGVPKVVAGERGAPTAKDRAVRGFYDAKAVMRRVEHWADATDGAKGVGPFTKYIWRPIKDAVNAYRIDRNKYVKKYVELLKQVVLPEGKIESKELDYTFGNANGGIGKAELLGALMHTGNDSNKKKLLVGRGWGSINEDGTLDSSRWDAFVARMIKQGVLTKSDFDFVQATWDLLEEVKPIAQKAHRSIFGFYFKEVEATPFTNEFGTFRGGYVPAKTDAFIVRDAQRQSKMEELEGDFRNSMPSTGMGFTKGRVEYNKPLSMDVRLVTKHIDDVLRFAHVQPAIKDVLRILKNRGFSDKLSRIDPTVIEDMLIPWLNRAARQVTSEPGRNKGMDKFWKAVRSRTGISIMAANLRNAMQQVTGLFPSALKVSKTQLGNALLTYMGSPLKTANEVASLSTFMNERLQSQIFDMQDDINEILLNPNAYNKVVKWTQKHSYFLQSAFQNMVDVVTWTAKYNQVLAESKVGASDTKVQREAIQQADAAVRLTQGSMSAEDISAYEVGTPFYKTFNQFGGYFNMLANLNADEYIKVIRDLGWRGNKGKLLNIYILGFVAPTLVADAIARSMGGGWDDDDDGYLDDVMDWFFGSQARAAVAMVPFGSTAATAITTAFNSKAYDDRITASPSIAALEASTIGVGKTIINIADDDKDVTGKNVRDVMTLISLATGTPVTVLGRPVGYLVDVNRKKVKPTGPIDVARGLVTGVASGESKKK